MHLSREEVEHVALLSRLKLSSDEIERFTVQLNSILEQFESLREADTEQVAGATHVVPMQNVMREDKRTPGFTPDEALSNAPERSDNLFKVPRVVE